MTRSSALFMIMFLGACSAELPTSPISAVQSQAQTAAVSKRRSAPPSVVLPAVQCSDPAPYLHSGERAPGYIVVYKSGIDSASTTARLAAKYGFTPKYVYGAALNGFASMLSVQTIAGLRCEPEVSFIEEDGYAHGG